MIPGQRTADGALYISTAAPLATDPRLGGICMTHDGAVKISTNGPQKFQNGFGMMNNGALCTSNEPIAGYNNGLPVVASGALKVQLNQPVSPGDAYVGGVRVGPLGGVYVTDAVPTPWRTVGVGP